MDELTDETRKRLLRIGQAVRRDAADLPVTTAQGSALSLLSGGAMSVGQLAQAEGVQPPTMTQLVNRMEAAGWVSRSGPARKGSTVQITAAGRRIVEEVRARRNGLLAERMAALTPDERAALRAVLPVFDKIFGPPLSPPGF
ncbi:MarR family winged helix-turn-helix transcriptional regulator [Streptomyces sp. NPDC048419]|uniref:MarR family winged helix-turn-helix transcriptional regulator n=1 Tax=Streptomyces sp. NPDC048419 TaxID=3365547 RepID=UPI00370FE891